MATGCGSPVHCAGRDDYGWTSRDYYIGEGKLLFYPCGL